MKRRPFIYLIFMLFLQGVFVYSLMGSTLYCSSSGDGRGPEDETTGGGDDEISDNDEISDKAPDADEEQAPPSPELKPDLNGACFSCIQHTSEGDTCGTALISGKARNFSFIQVGDTVSLNIANQITLTGTDTGIILLLTNSRVAFIGPGCNMTFTNISFTSDYPIINIVESGLKGTLAYDFKKSTFDDECASFPVTDCHAVHSVTCTTGC